MHEGARQDRKQPVEERVSRWQESTREKQSVRWERVGGREQENQVFTEVTIEGEKRKESEVSQLQHSQRIGLKVTMNLTMCPLHTLLVMVSTAPLSIP